jgi:hypothetical protein
MINVISLIEKNKLKASLGILISIIIFGYSFFPLANMDIYIVYIYLLGYGFLSICLEIVLNKFIFSYILVFLLTSIGMFIRFIIEYGEVFAKINFTIENIIIYPFVTSTYCIFVSYVFYLYKEKTINKNKQK